MIHILKIANNPRYWELQKDFDYLNNALKLCRVDSTLYEYILDRMDQIDLEIRSLHREECDET